MHVFAVGLSKKRYQRVPRNVLWSTCLQLDVFVDIFDRINPIKRMRLHWIHGEQELVQGEQDFIQLRIRGNTAQPCSFTVVLLLTVEKQLQIKDH